MRTWIARIFRDGVPAADAFDDAISEWHASDSGLPLHEYLGLTWPEYARCLEDPEAIRDVAERVMAREHGAS